jgi:site-specific recombinase XerD
VKTDKRLRPATINRELACLKALFSFVIKADLLAKNPVRRVKFLAENNQQTRVLNYTNSDGASLRSSNARPPDESNGASGAVQRAPTDWGV